MKDVCGWSTVSQLFVLGRVQLFVSATFKANVHEHEHEASWVTSPLKGSTIVIAIIFAAQCSCGISYMALCVWCFCACVRLRLTDLHVGGCKGKSLMCSHVPFVRVRVCFRHHNCVGATSEKCLSHISSLSCRQLLKNVLVYAVFYWVLMYFSACAALLQILGKRVHAHVCIWSQ